ncbi:alpha/beta hydrolase [Erwinia sp. CPCC 100877]|nr:alpha/beta hydrolase [Erwinia sp. CPCC 100877]
MVRRNQLYVLFAACILLIIVGCSGKQTTSENQQSTTSSSQTEVKTAVPTLFIHGYSGGNSSFGGMLKRLSSKTQKELTLSVSPTGIVQAAGQLSGKADNPSVQVIFEDNKNNEWNQAEWIKNCLRYLSDTYATKEVNLVGHSMGGVSSLRYLTTYGDDTDLPKVNKFVAIAAPFNNFVELSQGETLEDVLTNGPAVQSDRYIDLASGITKVATTMQTLIIAGDLQDGSLSDGTVPAADALSTVAMLKNHGNAVSEKVFYGQNAQHSQLHENLEVDQLVADFLWPNDKSK